MKGSGMAGNPERDSPKMVGGRISSKKKMFPSLSLEKVLKWVPDLGKQSSNAVPIGKEKGRVDRRIRGDIKEAEICSSAEHLRKEAPSPSERPSTPQRSVKSRAIDKLRF